MRSLTLTDSKQVKALASPIKSKIISEMRIHGHLTVSELAKRLNRKANSTTYHVNELVQLGLVVSLPGRGARGTLYQATANTFVIEDDGLSEGLKVESRRTAKGFLLAACRDLLTAHCAPDQATRNLIMIGRQTVCISPDRVRRLHLIIAEAQDILSQSDENEQPYSFTYLLAPK